MRLSGSLALAIVLLVSSLASAETKRALIIGINVYQPIGTTALVSGCAYSAVDSDGRCAIGTFDNLDGAVNDAQSISELLTSPKYHFMPKDVVLLTNPQVTPARIGIHVLPSTQTTRDGILAAMQTYLVDTPQKGDTVVFYDASHGSLRVNTAGDKLTVRDSHDKLLHVDSTLVPSDAYKGAYDIRDREMTRIFNAAVAKGIRLTVILDSCHSGGLTRGVNAHRRSLPYDPRPITDADILSKPTEDRRNPALVFSAVQQDQLANETQPTKASPEVHGAFTAALVETLQILPANAPAALVYQRVKVVLEGNGNIGQDPDLDAGTVRRGQPLFGGDANSTDTGKVRTEVLKIDAEGGVWLDIGMVSGIGPGSEFTLESDSGKVVTVSVKQPLGISRSKATVVSPLKAKVSVGDVFVLTKLVPSQMDPLFFWIGPTNISMSDILAAVAEINASGITTVSDVAEENYTDVLSWDGSEWSMQHVTLGSTLSGAISTGGVNSASPVRLGSRLVAASLKKVVTAGAKVWVNLPASRELAANLKLNDPNLDVLSTTDFAQAHYVLSGSLSYGKPAYAWFHKQEYAAGPRAVVTKDHTPGCSTTSPYPVRSAWVTTPDSSLVQNTSETLNTYSLRLARVYGWLQLANNPVAGASMANYYKLILLRASDATKLPADEPLHENDLVKLALQAPQPIPEKRKRWIYVLDIDCQGSGTLLYPRDHAENQYPNDGATDLQVLLQQAPTIRFQEPFGLESMILLSTSDPLSDPYVFDFSGVMPPVSRGTRSPFAKLLSNASSGTRGDDPVASIPLDWGIQVLQLRSVPGPAETKE